MSKNHWQIATALPEPKAYFCFWKQHHLGAAVCLQHPWANASWAPSLLCSRCTSSLLSPLYLPGLKPTFIPVPRWDPAGLLLPVTQSSGGCQTVELRRRCWVRLQGPMLPLCCHSLSGLSAGTVTAVTSVKQENKYTLPRHGQIRKSKLSSVKYSPSCLAMQFLLSTSRQA